MVEAPHNSPSDGINVPTPSTKTLVAAAIVLVVAAIAIRRLGNDGGDTSDEPDESAEESSEDITVEDLENGDSATIEVPLNPENELEKDEAVIEGLKDAGLLEVGS